MATVNKEIADMIIDGDGFYLDDPHVYKIVEYDNAWGGVGYGLIYTFTVCAQPSHLFIPSPYVRNPRTYWQAS